MIASDSKSIVQDYSQENLMPEQHSPETAMQLNENSTAAIEIQDPT